MTAVKPLEVADFSDEAKAVADEFCARMPSGKLPSIFRYLAHQPAVMRIVWEEIQTLMDPARPDHKQKHLIALAVCATAGSPYFAGHHSAALRREGATDEEIAEVLAVAQLWSGLSVFSTGLGLKPEGE